MTLAEIIRATADISPIQFIHECLTGAMDVKRKKNTEPHTRLTFLTQHMTCNDAFYWASGAGEARKPKYIGVVVWIPFEAYEKATAVDAVDPQAGSTGTPTPRDENATNDPGGVS